MTRDGLLDQRRYHRLEAPLQPRQLRHGVAILFHTVQDRDRMLHELYLLGNLLLLDERRGIRAYTAIVISSKHGLYIRS